MGFKNVMKKIGKIALTAAPYIAAPFTGGASLMATGLANKAVQKWSESDAKKAAAKGLAPSKFDSILGKVGGISSLATSFLPTNALGAVGMLGKVGGAASTASKVAGAANTASKMSKFASTLGNIGKGAIGTGSGWTGKLGETLGNYASSKLGGSGGSQQQYQPTSYSDMGAKGMMAGGTSAKGASNGMGVMPRGGYSWNQNPMNQEDQSNPNLAQSIFQGRQEAIRNQPFRRGYDVTTQVGEPNEETGLYETRTTKMPRIYSGGGRGEGRDQRKRKVAV